MELEGEMGKDAEIVRRSEGKWNCGWWSEHMGITSLSYTI